MTPAVACLAAAAVRAYLPRIPTPPATHNAQTVVSTVLQQMQTPWPVLNSQGSHSQCW